MSKETRDLKEEAHYMFDELWGRKVFAPRSTLQNNRKLAYEWLADELCMPITDCHIANFNNTTCKRVIEICKRRQIYEGIYKSRIHNR